MSEENLIALRAALKAIQNNVNPNPEIDHFKADDLLLEYIADAEVIIIYDSIKKWYV